MDAAEVDAAEVDAAGARRTGAAAAREDVAEEDDEEEDEVEEEFESAGEGSEAVAIGVTDATGVIAAIVPAGPDNADGTSAKATATQN